MQDEETKAGLLKNPDYYICGGGCGYVLLKLEMFRCWFCKCWYCSHCAEKHFMNEGRSRLDRLTQYIDRRGLISVRKMAAIMDCNTEDIHREATKASE